MALKPQSNVITLLADAHRFLGRLKGKILGLVVGVLGLFLGFYLPLAAQPVARPPHVLVLNSYHPGYSWSDGELQGVLRVLMREFPGLVPRVEFLDEKRQPTPDQLEALLEYIQRKYRDTHFDLIITLDDAALNFAIAHRERFGMEIPIVFGGVNDFQPEKFAGVSRLTGVAEAFDFVGNIELIQRLRPDARTIHLICDSADSSTQTMAAFRRIAPRFEGRIHIEPLVGWTAEELIRRVAALPPSDAALVVGNARDVAGRIVSEDIGFLNELEARSAVPIVMVSQPALLVAYGYGWEHALWFGIGGRMLSSDRHGEAVGGIAGRVLHGEDAGQIPVLTTSPTRVAFDYRQLMRHKIDLRLLPPEAELFNRPQSFYELYWGRILAAVGVIVLLAGTVIVLLLNNVRRHRAESALRRSNERFELIASATHDSVWDLDVASGALEGNDAFLRLLELPSDAKPDLNALLQLVHPEDLAAVKKFLVGPSPSLNTVSREIRLVVADGTVKFALLRLHYRRDATGQVTQVLGSMLDLTTLKQAENQLQLLMTAVDQATELIALLGSGGLIDYANPALAGALQWSPGAVPGHCRELWCDERGASIAFEVIAGLATAEGRWQQRIAFTNPDLTIRQLQVTVTPIRSSPGQPPRFLLVGQDVTQEARLEEQIRMVQKMDAIGTLASGIAHDFNNILTAITINTELAVSELPPGHPAVEIIGDVRTAAGRAAQLVRQILTFSRRNDPRREVLCVTPVIDETLRFLQATVSPSIVMRHTVVASPLVEVDPNQLYQVILNLCTNAVQAVGQRKGLVEVIEESVEVGPDHISADPDLRPGHYLLLSVRDDGRGMVPEVACRIFEPFYTTKGPGEGTGLGLAVVHGILKKHHAAITVYSTPGHGTVFRLYFPVAVAAVAAPVRSTAGSLPRGNGQRIVLVDDEEPITRVASRLLRQIGYGVTEFKRPEEALRHLQREGGDLLITDFAMPEFNGLVLIAKVRGFAPKLPVILISGYLASADRKEAESYAGCQIVDKPLTIATLSEAVARAVSNN